MRFLILVTALLIFSACTKLEENFIIIPSEFTIAVYESIKIDGTRDLQLELSSLIANYCQEDSLIYKTNYDSSFYSIQILDSYKANNCSQKNYFLKSNIAIPYFNDSISIFISLGAASLIKIRISISDKEYNIQLIEGTGLIKKYNQTFKIPENLIWGYAYPKSVDPTIETLMNNFKRDIEFDCSTNRLAPGFYSNFKILENYTIVILDNPGIVGSYLNFYYTHSKSAQELSVFFNELESKYSNLIGYKINTGSGKEFIAL